MHPTFRGKAGGGRDVNGGMKLRDYGDLAALVGEVFGAG